LATRFYDSLNAFTTDRQDQYDSLLDYYASIVLDQADRLKTVSDIFVADGYFWRRPFVDMVTQAGFRFISKLPSNAVLQYPYLGPKPKRRGRPPKYSGRVDRLNLDSTHFTPCLQEGNLIAYEGKVYVKALDRLVKCVIVHLAKKDGTLRAEAFFFTDPTMDGTKVLECYGAATVAYDSR
jgi:putative transposase